MPVADRLLLIDDNPPDRIRYRHMLKRAPEPYEVVEAATAAAGLAALDDSIDAVLLDQDLPDMLGLDVLAAIRARVDPPVVVMLTGEEDAAVCVEALRRGAADYLMKRRIDEDNLFRAVRGAIERGRLERQVTDQQRRLALFYRLASQTDDALFIIDPTTGEVTECNHSARQWLGVWPAEEGMEPFVPAAFGSVEEWRQFLDQADDTGAARFEWTVPGGDGAPVVCEILARRVEEQGAPYIVAVGRDITTRLDHERRLVDQTQRDALTGIANRRALDKRLSVLWQAARRMNAPLGAIMVDVDHFKAYNDALGHQGGDECLRAVAAALAGVEHEGAFVARYGGEEFAVLVPVAETSTARGVAEQLRRAVEALVIRHPASSVGPHVTVSVGVASRIPGQSEEPDALFGAADQALYRAKSEGRNRVVSAFPF